MAVTKDPRRGGILGGLLFGVFAMVVLLVAGGFFIAKNIRIQTGHRHGGDDVSIETPGGSINIRAHEDLDPGVIGLPVYPGARKRKDSGIATFEWTSPDGKQEKGVAVGGANLITEDPESKVLAWYRAQLPNWIVSTDQDGSTRFELNKGGYKRMVIIHEKRDGTHIGVASIGDPASN